MKKKRVIKKVYGEDNKFVFIYEMIKMRVPISVEMKDYFKSEHKYYTLLFKL